MTTTNGFSQTSSEHRTATGEAALIEAAQAGDELAFQRLLRRHRGLLEQQPGASICPAQMQTTCSRRRGSGSRGRCATTAPTAAELWNLRARVRQPPARQCCDRRQARQAANAERSRPRPGGRARLGGPAGSRRQPPGAGARTGSRAASSRAGPRALERQLLAHALVGWSSGEAARRLGLRRKRASMYPRHVSPRCPEKGGGLHRLARLRSYAATGGSRRCFPSPCRYCTTRRS